MAQESRLSNIVWERHPSLYVAAQSTYVNSDDAENINKYAWLARKHDELIEMPTRDRAKAFSRLDDDVQELLKGYFDTDYGFDDQPDSVIRKIAGGALSIITSPIRAVFGGAEAYGRGLGAAYIKGTNWDKYGWSEAYDGEKLFDSEEDAKLRAMLPEEVYKISKLAAMGESPGRILATLETDAEFEAFEQFVQGNELFKDSISRFKSSKISFGRDFARNIFNLKSDDSLLFKTVSGFADLGYQIFADPMTYATFGVGKGFQLAGVGIVRGSRAISSFMGPNARNIDDLFVRPGVRKYWDKLGQNIKDLDSGDADIAGNARMSIERLFQESNDAKFIDILRKEKIYDANAAHKFFSQQEKLEYLLKGKIRIDRQVMPTWGWGKELRKNMGDIIDSVFYNGAKETSVLKTLKEHEDGLIKSGENFSVEALELVPDSIKLAKEQRSARERFARLFEKAPVVSGIRILKKEERIGKKKVLTDEFVESSDDIYKIARIVYSRRDANVVRYAFEQADTAQRFLMLRGLYVQVGQAMGLADTVEGRNFLRNAMRAQFDNAYTEGQKLTDLEIDNIAKSNPTLAQTIRQNDNTWTPNNAGDGNNNAAVHWQVGGQIMVPRFDIWNRQARSRKNAAGRFFGGALDSKLHDEVSQYWTLFTLFPRNGVRGAIDEMLTFGLTAPLTSILKWQGARALSRSIREVQDPSQKTLLLYQQFLRKTVLQGLKVDAADYKAIIEDRTGETFKKVVNRQFLKETTRTVKLGKLSDEDLRYIESAINNGVFFDNLPYVQGGTTKGYKNANPNASLYDETLVGQNAIMSFNVEKVLEDMREAANLIQDKGSLGSGLYTKKPQMIRFAHGKENEFLFSWTEQIFSRVSHDPAAARIFLKHHNNPDLAIRKIAAYYRKDKTIMNRLQMRATAQGVDPILDAATNHFMHLRAVLFGSDGQLLEPIKNNMGKIITRDPQTKVESLNLDWFGENLRDIIKGVDFNLAPDTLIAKVYEFKGLSKNAGEFIQKMTDGMWGIMDNQASMMFREPAYFVNYMFNRKKLKGAESEMVSRLVKSGHTQDEALKLADIHFSNLSGKLAMERTIAYIDNPLVRSNFAFYVRNFARFFRATEDFYRRYGRAFKNDPQSLIRLRLATQGLSGSGFIHENDDGEQYFIVPGDSWMWQVSSNLYKTLTGNEMLAVNPIEFGVKIQMISPSLDPDSALPSLAGPVSAIPVKAINKILNTELIGEAVPGSFKRGFDKYALGVYSENSSLFDAMLPGAARRLMNALTPNERNAQFVSATQQAILYTASNPNIKTPGPDATYMEKQEFLAQVKATAANIIFLRNMLGLVAPAGLSSMETKDIPDYIKETGFSSLNREFYKLVESLNSNMTEDAWSEALLKWTYNEKNLGKLVYTVSRTERTGPSELVKIQSTKEAADWVASNPKLVRKYPTASLLFAPQIGEFDIGAYSYLKLNGYIKNKDIDTFLTDINLVQAKREYFQIGRIYEDRIASTADAGTKSLYRRQLEGIRREMRALNPELERELADYSFSMAREQETIEELRSLLASGLVDNNPRNQRLKLMLKRFDENRTAYAYSINNGLNAESRRNISIAGMGELEGIAGKDKNLLLALDSIFAPILER